jgi:uncharacterized YccA/Bax inhibitor family protein
MWTLNALISAEELGITSANVAEMAAAPTANPEINRILGTEGEMGAMMGLMAFYLVSFIIGMFGSMPSFINDASPMGIAFSLFVAGLAAFNLALDFDMIEKGVANKLPAHMEWFCALGVVVTLVWLYLEILRLLSKLRER